jgi:hypothetical protein
LLQQYFAMSCNLFLLKSRCIVWPSQFTERNLSR